LPGALGAFAKVLPLTHALALMRYGLLDPHGTSLHDIWGMSNPATDPHTYEASSSIAQEISAAQLVVQNGVGYDTFMTTIENAPRRRGSTSAIASSTCAAGCVAIRFQRSPCISMT